MRKLPVLSIRNSAVLAVAVLAVALLGYLLVGRADSGRPVEAATVKPGKDRHQAPDFALKDADGKVVHLSDYRGKVVLLDFWATWCGPCRIEIPWFMDLERKNKDRGFAVLGVSMDDEGWEVVKPFLAELGVNYRVMMGSDSTAQAYGGVDSLPTTFLIDRDGKIAAVHIGLGEPEGFRRWCRTALADDAPAGNGNRAALPAVSLGAR